MALTFIHEFHPTKEEDDFVVGRLGEAPYSGVYLPTAYLDRLREVMYAASRRLDTVDPRTVPDAVLNVVGIANRLVQVHATQLRTENHPGSDADRAEVAKIEAEMTEALRQIKRLSPNPDDGSDP